MQKQIEKNNLFKEANPTPGNSNEYYKLSLNKTTSENYSRIKERRREGKAYDLLNNNPLDPTKFEILIYSYFSHYFHIFHTYIHSKLSEMHVFLIEA